MAYPNLSPLPTPPNPDAPATFDTLAYPFTVAQVAMVAQINALVAQLNDTFFPDMPILAGIRGTAAAPVYTFGADPNTGMFSPAENVLAWSTNGAERLRLGATGLLTSSTAIIQSASDDTSGRITTTGYGGLGGYTISAPASTSWASLTATKFVSAPAAPAQPTDKPFANSLAYIGMHMMSSATRWADVVVEASGASMGRVYVRAHNSGTTTDWRRLVDFTNIVGPVAQSAGLPTGAIIEHGSNANGEYIRFADGTQICFGTVNCGPCTTAAGSGFSTTLTTWTYPASFVSATEKSVSAGGVSNSARWVAMAGPGGSTQGVRAMSFVSDAADHIVRVMVIGRWY